MTTLYGPDNRPIPASRTLRKEESAPSMVKIRSPYSNMTATGMTPTRIIRMLRDAARGQQGEWLDYSAEMERRDAHYFSLLQTRKFGVCNLKWHIEAPTADVEDVATTETLREIFSEYDMHGIIFDMQDALGKGYSIQEMIWGEREGWLVPQEIKWRDPRHFKLADGTADKFLLKSDDYPNGRPLKPYKYIVHTPSLTSGLPIVGGLARVCVGMHLYKSYAMRDWMAFAELYGMPLRIGKHPKNATPDEVETLRECLRDIGSDAAAVIPSNLEILFERSAMSGLSGGDDFFATLLRTCNEEMSKAIVGQTMTADDGSSQAQAKVHYAVKTDIGVSDARGTEATINRCLLRAIIDVNLGRRTISKYPKFKFATEEPEDLLAFSQAIIPFVDRGLHVEASVIRDLFMVPDPDGAEDELLESIELIKAKSQAEFAPEPTEPENKGVDK